MITFEDKCVEGIERRGRVFYMRIRVPAKYASVEKRKEINRSLKTRDYEQAKAHFVLAKEALRAEWEFLIAQQNGETSAETYDAALNMLHSIGFSFKSQSELFSGPLDRLLARIEALEKVDKTSATVPAILGVMEYPVVQVSEAPQLMVETNKRKLVAKNARQLNEWTNKYEHAARCFVAIVGDMPILSISEHDAMTYHRHWRDLRDSDEITTDHAQKRLRFMRQLVDAYYVRFDVPLSQRSNPFNGLKIKREAVKSHEPKRLALPVQWVKRHIIDQEGLEGLNAQARDIATIAADTGCRQTEIADLPSNAIHLNCEIPHIRLAPKEDGADKRELKNGASERVVVLLGAALDAMRRNPLGFDRYRGKKSYSATINKYLRDRGLFPDVPAGMTGKYTASSTRHTFEDRMSAAKMTNEECAQLMGHSVGAVRKRPVYGSKPDLELIALLQEMVSFPTKSWEPRSIATLRAEIDRHRAEQGFRVE